MPVAFFRFRLIFCSLLIICLCLFFLTACDDNSDDPELSEYWEITLDDDTSTSGYVFIMADADTLSCDGEFTVAPSALSIRLAYSDGSVTSEENTFEIIATGIAFSDRQLGDSTECECYIYLNGDLTAGSGNGTYRITFEDTGWPTLLEGEWQGTCTDGYGITPGMVSP